MSYYSANFGNEEYKQQVESAIKSKLNQALELINEGEPGIAVSIAQEVANLGSSEEIHEAIVESLNSDEKKQVKYYSCNLMQLLSDNIVKEANKLLIEGHKSEAVKLIKSRI